VALHQPLRLSVCSYQTGALRREKPCATGVAVGLTDRSDLICKSECISP
jgi:hypothetical protein